MSEFLVVGLSILFFVGNFFNLNNDMPKRLANISNVIFHGSVFICWLYGINEVLYIGCVVGWIAIALYRYACDEHLTLEGIIVVAADLLHKVLVVYGVTTCNYFFALVSTIVMYTLAVILGWFIGYMSRNN